MALLPPGEGAPQGRMRGVYPKRKARSLMMENRAGDGGLKIAGGFLPHGCPYFETSDVEPTGFRFFNRGETAPGKTACQVPPIVPFSRIKIDFGPFCLPEFSRPDKVLAAM